MIVLLFWVFGVCTYALVLFNYLCCLVTFVLLLVSAFLLVTLLLLGFISRYDFVFAFGGLL